MHNGFYFAISLVNLIFRMRPWRFLSWQNYWNTTDANCQVSVNQPFDWDFRFGLKFFFGFSSSWRSVPWFTESSMESFTSSKKSPGNPGDFLISRYRLTSRVNFPQGKFRDACPNEHSNRFRTASLSFRFLCRTFSSEVLRPDSWIGITSFMLRLLPFAFALWTKMLTSTCETHILVAHHTQPF